MEPLSPSPGMESNRYRISNGYAITMCAGYSHEVGYHLVLNKKKITKENIYFSLMKPSKAMNL